MNPETDFSIRTFSGGYDKNLTYLVTCSRTGTQVIIDAAIEINAISEYLRSDPIAILITHGHNDHTAYLNEYIQQYPNINVLGHPDSHIRELSPHFKKVEDNQGFIIGEMNFKSIHSPGHFFDSICFFTPGT